jgi:hypothetical protein
MGDRPTSLTRSMHFDMRIGVIRNLTIKQLKKRNGEIKKL